jgi:hypothetical protein
VTVDIGTISGGVTAVVFGGGAMLGLVRLNMRGVFASVRQYHDLEQRVDAVEERVARGPNHQDLAAMSVRLAAVELGVGVMGATLTGVKESVGRIEKMTDMLVQSQLEAEKHTQ